MPAWGLPVFFLKPFLLVFFGGWMRALLSGLGPCCLCCPASTLFEMLLS